MLDVVLTTDWHLDGLARFFDTDEQAIDVQMREIEKPFEYAVNKGVKKVWVLGDLGEHPTLSDYAALSLLRLFLKYDGVLDIEVIRGNHDFRREGSDSLLWFSELYSYEKFKSIRIHTNPLQEKIDGVWVNFLPFPAVKGLKTKDGKPALNLAHIEPSGALRDNGNKIKKGIDISGKDFWLIGHLHRHQVFTNALLPGTLFQKNFGETLPKGFIHFKAKMMGDKLKTKFEFIQNNPAFRLETVEVNGEKDWDQISSDPMIFYRVYCGEGVVVPEGFLDRHPNVIDWSGNHIQVKNEDGEIETAELDHKDNVKRFLSRKFELTRPQLKRALQLDAEARTELGIQT